MWERKSADTALQPQCLRAAGAARPHGEEADEGFHERQLFPMLDTLSAA